jgi:predicted NBD/HSP70 family sugar kinase
MSVVVKDTNPPSAPLDVLSRGTSQSGVRLYNERLVLSLIRRHGALPKAEIARRTGLSAQTISVIMRQLEADELVLPQERVRGKVGQPSVPYALNREGAFSIGLKVGRRSADLILIDFVGNVIRSLGKVYPYPTPDNVLKFVSDGLKELTTDFPDHQMKRISGVGVAIPFELWVWASEVGAPAGAMDGWRTWDVKVEIERICPWPVYICNDATAACAAELVFGIGAEYNDFLYIFVGFFVGGGLVLDGNLVTGQRGYAGSLGPMPVPSSGGGRPSQLVQAASIYLLEAKLVAAGLDPDRIKVLPGDWLSLEAPLDQWIDETAEAIAFAIVSAQAVVEIEAVIIDGGFPPEIRTRLVARIEIKISKLDRRGLSPTVLLEGSVGRAAREIGGASLPLLANFARDREVMFKE